MVANLRVAGTLTIVAAAEKQWGFLLLEGVWMIVSATALARIVAGRGA